MKIVPFAPSYRAAFKALNEEWILQYFQLEPADFKVLDFPEANILAKGGHIFVALSDDEAVGVCALVKLDEETFELAKMAVSPKMQGKGIGHQLALAAIARAREEGAQRVYLESNTRLERALTLYRRLGFEVIPGRPSPYERSNIKMELRLH